MTIEEQIRASLPSQQVIFEDETIEAIRKYGPPSSGGNSLAEILHKLSKFNKQSNTIFDVISGMREPIPNQAPRPNNTLYGKISGGTNTLQDIIELMRYSRHQR